jgi:hypothetical protein
VGVSPTDWPGTVALLDPKRAKKGDDLGSPVLRAMRTCMQRDGAASITPTGLAKVRAHTRKKGFTPENSARKVNTAASHLCAWVVSFEDYAARAAKVRNRGTRMLETTAGAIAICEAGPPGGQLAVLLHGTHGQKLEWRYLWPTLHHYGYRTVAMDMPGHAESPGKPLGKTGANSRGRVCHFKSSDIHMNMLNNSYDCVYL